MKKQILIVSMILCGCKTSTDGNPTADLIPLKEGSRWIYEVHDSSGTTYDTTICSPETDIQGMFGYRFQMGGVNYFFANRNNGLWVFDSILQQNILEYEFPAASGTTYIVAYDTSSDDTSSTVYEIRGSIISTNEQCITDAGSFSCYHYRIAYEKVHFFLAGINKAIATTNEESVGEMLFAPGIGIVKELVPNSIYEGYPNGYKVIRTLKSFSLH